MKTLIIFCLLFLGHVILIGQTQAQKKERLFEVPSEYVSLLLVSDEACPLLPGNPKFYKYEKSTYEFDYTILNRTDKYVKNFEKKVLSWFGNTEHTGNLAADSEYLFLPHVTLVSFTEEEKNEVEFVNFDEKNLEKFGLRRHPKEIWILMVTKVELSDGSIYDVTSKYESIKKFVEKLRINSKLSKSQIDDKEKSLRKFISKIMTIKD